MKTAVPTGPPDPEQTAQREAAAILANRELAIYGGLERKLSDSPHVDRETVLAGVEAFHAERMKRIPSPSKHPDAQPWVEHVLAVDRRVRELANLSPRENAVLRSFGDYMTFRGFREFGRLRGLAQAAAADAQLGVERCRVAFVPDTDRGAVHIKNLDDPPTHWAKRPPLAAFPEPGLVWDATGSGLHIDDEPAEIFPLPVKAMCLARCDDVPGAVEFLGRYSPFWGRANVVLFDAKRRTAAIEKCSFNHMQTHAPDRHGRSHVSGMVCRDPQSPIGRYQRARRDEYRKLFGLPDDGPDAAFWNGSTRAEAKLSGFLGQETVRADDLCKLFVTPRTEGGLNKNGDRLHPQQVHLDLTLATTAHFLDEKRTLRWQREPGDLSWPAEPEVYDFDRR